MDRSRLPPASGGAARRRTDRLGPALLIALFAISAASATAVGLHAPAAAGTVGAPHDSAAGSPILAQPEPQVPAPADAVHGDLVVTPANSPYEITPATNVGSIYYLGGNLTVESGATLVVRNVTIEIVQFVGATGDVLARTGHLFHFTDQGTIELDGAAITADTQILNAYPKVVLNISGGGVLTADHSVFAFPGTIQVYGTGSSFNASASSFTPDTNPLATFNATINRTIAGDTAFSPSLSVAGGARAILAGGEYLDMYRDNLTLNGAPDNPINSTAAPVTISSGGGDSWTSWTTARDSENLTRDLLYPTVAAGSLVITYFTNTTQSAAANSFNYGGAVSLGSIAFDSSDLVVTVPLPAAAIQAINAGGLPAFYEATGAFGGSSSTVSVALGATNQPAGVEIDSIAIELAAPIDYNLTVAGTGSTLTLADLPIDLTWNLTAGSPFPPKTYPPQPWGSSKLLVTGGATAYLANVSTFQPYTDLYWDTSCVLPDAASHVYFYRWAEVPVTAAADVPILGAHLVGFYAYDATQPANATVTSLNDLATADPELWSYAATAHASAYATTGSDGLGYLLLASGELDGTNLPDGVFLGNYHIGVTLAGGGSGSSQWGYLTTEAYPYAFVQALPDATPAFSFPTYAPFLAIGAVTVFVDNASVSAVAIGQNLTIHARITDAGSGPVTDAQVSWSYLASGPSANGTPLGAPVAFGSIPSGGGFNVTFSWVVNESVTGDLGFFNGSFALVAAWNTQGGSNSGSTTDDFTVPIAPSQIALSITPPDEPLEIGPTYDISGSVEYNGTGQATINITAISSTGVRYALGSAEVGATLATTGPFDIGIALQPGMPSGQYSLEANASYNGRSAVVTDANAFSIAGAAAPAPSFLDQTFLGLKVLYWIFLAIAIVAAVIVLLFLLRQTARGKLVECGECGQLIPEAATVCPKCGAEFENDLVRCSRCGSTIPANSAACPECSAQLIGRPEEAARDPERQAYNDFVERFRAEAKKELGENYGEGAFWDWWKRQPTYLPYSQWRLQQQQGSRAGMAAPPTAVAATDADAAPAGRTPPKRPGGGSGAASGGGPPPGTARPTARSPPPAAAAPAATTTPAAAAPSSGPGTAEMKPCPNCGKEIPPDYLVCPFCGAVTQ